VDVPVWDLGRQQAAIENELRQAFDETLASATYTLGGQLAAFESEFAAYCGCSHAIGVSSGTAALHLALRALGVGPGDEVITVPNTYVATVFAITYTGATPVLVDVDPLTGNLDPAQVPAALTTRTKAILPVHLYGRAADVDGIRAAAPSIPVLEDAAHAHGATSRGRMAGSLGAIAAWSFYPRKVMGALGDGGAVTTNDGELAAAVRQLRYMGQSDAQHDHQALGYQDRLDELQASLLRVKLRHLEGQLVGRERVAARYEELLAGTPLELPPRNGADRHAWYMYAVHGPRRDGLRQFLAARGIATLVVYPRLVPDQGAYREHPIRVTGDLPVARSLVARNVCLPMFAELTDDEVERVAAAVHEFYGDG
jgi:dTDP-4-amino-4,6-dideoxygalactose transaminase